MQTPAQAAAQSAVRVRDLRTAKPRQPVAAERLTNLSTCPLLYAHAQLAAQLNAPFLALLEEKLATKNVYVKHVANLKRKLTTQSNIDD